MATAEFEEKEYELSADLELGSGRAPAQVFPSGQVLEAVLGYDAVAHPAARSHLWAILNVPRPSGVVLLPVHWAPGLQPSARRLPQRVISLVLQYKRPEYLRGPAAKQWHRWRRPYFRFERTSQQHQVLTRLERSLGGAALVRYAAPAFSTYAALEAARATSDVLARSGFVAPSVLGRHKVWTYDQPGTSGYPNPSGRARTFETLESLVSAFAGAPVAAGAAEVVMVDGLADHLELLAAAAGLRQPRLRQQVAIWQARVGGLELVDGPVLTSLARLALVQSLMTSIGASWWLMER